MSCGHSICHINGVNFFIPLTQTPPALAFTRHYNQHMKFILVLVGERK